MSGGLGHSGGKIWRIGVMGYNAKPEVVDRTLKLFKEALESQGFKGKK